MLVTFVSSETGELMMFSDVAGQLLRACGKPTSAEGAFTVEEMRSAAERLRGALAASGGADEGGSGKPDEEPSVALGSRAWPFIDMLERTARGGSKANIVWKAAADF